MIDVAFDFTTDTPKGKDPDTYSPTLCTYHQALWSKDLPNGEHMTLEATRAPFSLKWKDFNLSSDSIIVEMNYVKNKKVIDQVNSILDDADAYFEKLRQVQRWFDKNMKDEFLPTIRMKDGTRRIQHKGW